MHDEDPRQLAQQPGWLQPEPVRERGSRAASPHNRINEGSGAGVPELERSVMFEGRIAHVQRIAQSVSIEPRLCDVDRLGMNERDARPAGFDLRPQPGDISHGFAAERTAEVSKKDDESWRTIDEAAEARARGKADEVRHSAQYAPTPPASDHPRRTCGCLRTTSRRPSHPGCGANGSWVRRAKSWLR